MTDPSNANKERSREIARNEEARQIAGSVRVTTWAIAVGLVIGAVVFALIWIVAHQ